MSIADRLLFLRTALIVIDLTLISGIYAFGAAELTCQQMISTISLRKRQLIRPGGEQAVLVRGSSNAFQCRRPQSEALGCCPDANA
jgi:hypothetical protein